MLYKVKAFFFSSIEEVKGALTQLPRALTQNKQKYDDPWSDDAEDKTILSRWRLLHWGPISSMSICTIVIFLVFLKIFFV
uniref:Uncharacterized protein n=1 Tax=Meloidogyne enterolobii TaxID=390850 RepID=A0A6V7UXB2_MELEN|nr:unnamed protein product [Meloidogyne enterolobii]CAD2167252.1 unnamed protein product [Meloidogyne enterolobii]